MSSVGEIGSAYVKIRPDTTGFKEQVTHRVRDAFIGVGSAIGLGFSAEQTFTILKGAITSAGQLQTAQETITQVFGKSAGAVKTFGEDSGVALGLSAEQADTAAASFGVLFGKMGIAQPLAAQMTINFEKLAGTMATLKGVNASTALVDLEQAAQGNVRGLRQLGITITATAEKGEAMKLGFGNSVAALTPAQKAVVIYKLAIANLGVEEELAARHSHDWSVVQSKLTAAWSNAKDAIGTALLPYVTKYGSELEKWLVKATKSGEIQRDVNTVMRDTGDVIKSVKSAYSTLAPPVERVTHALGGVKTVALTLGTAFAVDKILNFGKAFSTGLVSKINSYVPAALKAGDATKGIGTSADSAAAVAVPALAKIQASLDTLVGSSERAETGMKNIGFGAEQGALVATPPLNTVKENVGAVGTEADVTEATTKGAFLGIGISADALGAAIKGAIVTTGFGAVIIGVSYAAQYVITHWAQVKQYTIALGAAIEQTWKDVKSNVSGTAELLGGTLLTALTAPLRVFLEELKEVIKVGTGIPVIGHFIGKYLGGNAAVSGLDSLISGLNKFTIGLVKSGAAADNFSNIKTAFDKSLTANAPPEASSFLGLQKVPGGGDPVAQEIADLKAELAAAGKGPGSIGDSAANALFNNEIANEIANAKQHLADAIAAGKQKVANAYSSYIQALAAGQQRIKSAQTSVHAAYTAYTQGLASDQVNLKNQIAAGQKQIADAAVAAQNNLQTIASKLESSINNFFKQGGTAAGGSAAMVAQFSRLKGLLAGGNTAAITNAALGLSQTEKEKVKTPQTAIDDKIATLLDEFNKGQLTATQTRSQLQAFLKSEGVTRKNLVAQIGKGLTDTLYGQLQALFKQARDIGRETPKQRKEGAGGAEAGSGVKVINVADTIAAVTKKDIQDRNKIDRDEANRTTRLSNALDRLTTVEKEVAGEDARKRGKLADARAAAAKSEDRARHAEIMAAQRANLRMQARAEQIAKRNAKANAKTAASNAAINASNMGGNGTAFPTSTGKNPGRTIKGATTTATGGISSG